MNVVWCYCTIAWTLNPFGYGSLYGWLYGCAYSPTQRKSIFYIIICSDNRNAEQREFVKSDNVALEWGVSCVCASKRHTKLNRRHNIQNVCAPYYMTISCSCLQFFFLFPCCLVLGLTCQIMNLARMSLTVCTQSVYKFNDVRLS